MLELDYILQTFCERSLDNLTDHEVVLFEQLLKTPDNLLHEYLIGKTISADSDMNHVVAKIRQSITH